MVLKPYQRAAIVYVVVASLWIYSSDKLVAFSMEASQDIIFAQNIKGWLYVLITGVLLYVIVKRDFKQIESSHAALIKSYDETLRGWINVLDLRDNETKNHTDRVTRVAVELARIAGLSSVALEAFERGAMLHDIGKMGIPDSILNKPGKLTDEEYLVIKQHPNIAYELIHKIDFLKTCIDIPYCHHEKWDGTGYPRGLKAEQIPFSARLFAIVDVWDALGCERVYKKAWPEHEILELIKRESGHHFDPFVVELFLTHYTRLMEAARCCS